MNVISGYAFENYVAKIFTEAGYSIEQDVQLGKGVGDIDIVAEKEGKNIVLR